MRPQAPMYLHPPHPQPAAPKGFSHINRYWDKQQGVYAAKILPGQFYVSTAGEMIVTVLGSCISACVRDKYNRVGGMNHFNRLGVKSRYRLAGAGSMRHPGLHRASVARQTPLAELCE